MKLLSSGKPHPHAGQAGRWGGGSPELRPTPTRPIFHQSSAPALAPVGFPGCWVLTRRQRGRPQQAPPGLEVGHPFSLCSPPTLLPPPPPRAHSRGAANRMNRRPQSQAPERAHAQPRPPRHPAPQSHLPSDPGSLAALLPRRQNPGRIRPFWGLLCALDISGTNSGTNRAP